MRDPARQEIPGSFDKVYAMSRSYQEKPGAGRWSVDDESRAYQLSYTIPAEDLPQFWQSIVAKASQVRIPNRRGEPSTYFNNPRIMMQAHDLKNTFGRPSLNETLSLFEWTTLAYIDPDKVDMRSCWIDVGARDFVASAGTRELRHSEPFTLLWKSDCMETAHKRLLGAAPGSSLSATHYRSFLLRDAGNLTSTVRRTKAPNVAHPASLQTGIARAKAYAAVKEEVGAMFSSYGIFSSAFLPLLALDEDMMRDLAAVSKRDCGYETRVNRQSLHKAWEANKRHVRTVANPKTLRNYSLRKEVTFRLDAVLTMWSRGAFDPDANPHTGPMSRVIAMQPEADEPHYPFWVVPSRHFNALLGTQAARLVVPLDHLFKEASPSPSSVLHNPADGPIRRILAFYTAQLLCRLLVHSLSSQRPVYYDKWLWLSRWRAKAKGGAYYERLGLGLDVPIKASGMLWMPGHLFDWQGGHLALETLNGLYMPRSPLQARLASQANVQTLTTSKVTVEFFIKEWHRDAKLAFKKGRKKEGLTIANRIIRLCAEEIARAYHQHMLGKLDRFWELARQGHDGKKLAVKLPVLKRAQESAAAEVGKIVTAQTIWEIYSEAWTLYATALQLEGTDNGPTMPSELPCWMKARKHYLPPDDGWSEYVFGHLFGRAKEPAWNGRSHFLQVYRSFKSLWAPISGSAGQFDNRLKRIIGTFILVTFNSNNTKEVGTNHYQSSWHYGKPTFFQVQFRAPYFSPPQDSLYLHLDAVYKGPDLPGGLAPDAAPRVLTADKFQQLERAVHQDWVRLMDPTIESVSENERTKHCRRALRHMILLAGPSWAADKKVDHVVPWRRGKDDFFRLPVEAAKSLREGADDLLCEPTIFLPTRHSIMKLARRIESFSGLSAEVKQCIKWVRRRLNNGGNQYDIRSHLEARNKATEVTRQTPSLLGEFLSQTEPPQRCIQPGESDEVETDSDSGWFGSESEEEELPESDDLASLVYDSTIDA